MQDGVNRGLVQRDACISDSRHQLGEQDDLPRKVGIVSCYVECILHFDPQWSAIESSACSTREPGRG